MVLMSYTMVLLGLISHAGAADVRDFGGRALRHKRVQCPLNAAAVTAGIHVTMYRVPPGRATASATSTIRCWPSPEPRAQTGWSTLLWRLGGTTHVEAPTLHACVVARF